jgi:nitric oxide reductase NorQ protein
VEVKVVATESGLPPDRARTLVSLARRLRELKGHDLEEGVSTRLLVYCALLLVDGVSMEEAVMCAIIEPMTDDAEIKKGLIELARIVLG